MTVSEIGHEAIHATCYHYSCQRSSLCCIVCQRIWQKALELHVLLDNQLACVTQTAMTILRPATGTQLFATLHQPRKQRLPCQQCKARVAQSRIVAFVLVSNTVCCEVNSAHDRIEADSIWIAHGTKEPQTCSAALFTLCWFPRS